MKQTTPIERRQRGLAGVAIAAVLLVACSSVITPEERARMTPAQTLYEIQVNYNAALAGAVAYAEQPRCTESLIVGCHDPAVVAELAGIDQKITAALAVAHAATEPDAIAAGAALARQLLAEFQSAILASRVE